MSDWLSTRRSSTASALPPDEILGEAFWVAGKALRRAAVTVGETDPSKIEAEEAIRAADRVLGALFHD